MPPLPTWHCLRLGSEDLKSYVCLTVIKAKTRPPHRISKETMKVVPAPPILHLSCLFSLHKVGLESSCIVRLGAVCVQSSVLCFSCSFPVSPNCSRVEILIESRGSLVNKHAWYLVRHDKSPRHDKSQSSDLCRQRDRASPLCRAKPYWKPALARSSARGRQSGLILNFVLSVSHCQRVQWLVSQGAFFWCWEFNGWRFWDGVHDCIFF